MFYSAYAREEGKAKVFIEGMNRKIFLFSLLIAILCVTAIWGLRGLYIFLIASALIFLVNKFIERQIGGITGDTLGAVSELTEVMVLIVVCILRK
jgi:adenosylcobinamide-GDP ribazoletransferase